MRRIKKVFPSVLLSFILCFSVPLSGFCAITNFEESYAAVTYTNIEGTNIYYEQGISNEDYVAVVTGWLLLPESVRVSLVSSGCRIYLSDSAGTDSDSIGMTNVPGVIYNPVTGEIAGFSSTPYIVIRTESPNIAGTLIHEVGHVFDTIIAMSKIGIYSGSMHVISDSDAWNALYETYGNSLTEIDANSARSNVEAFAVAFKEALINPEEFSASCPELYNYVIACIETFS